MEPNKEDKLRKMDEEKDGLDDGVPELLQLKTVQEHWNSYEHEETLAS